ncbi:hypothetical protein RFI_24382, partial [Reticulomyxa filosa]
NNNNNNNDNYNSDNNDNNNNNNSNNANNNNNSDIPKKKKKKLSLCVPVAFISKHGNGKNKTNMFDLFLLLEHAKRFCISALCEIVSIRRRADGFEYYVHYKDCMRFRITKVFFCFLSLSLLSPLFLFSAVLFISFFFFFFFFFFFCLSFPSSFSSYFETANK